MTFLEKKLKENLPKDIFNQLLLMEDKNLAEFEVFYDTVLNFLQPNQLFTLKDYFVAKIKVPLENKLFFLQKMLKRDEPYLREKNILLLEGLLQQDCLPMILPFRLDEDKRIRAEASWVLAKYTSGDEGLTQQIIDDLTFDTPDNEQILLAAALFQRNHNPSSIEMRFLKNFYLEHYYDQVKQSLKVSLTGEYGHAAQFLGLILWEADIKIFAVDSLEIHNALWLVEEIKFKVPL